MIKEQAEKTIETIEDHEKDKGLMTWLDQAFVFIQVRQIKQVTAACFC